MWVQSISGLTLLGIINWLAYAVSAHCAWMSLRYRMDKARDRQAEETQPVTLGTRERVFAWLRWLWNDEPAQGTSTFLKSAGLILLLLDLLVCIVRLIVLGIYLISQEQDFWNGLKSDRYIAGLAIESAWLQALWILHTHFTIQACIRRRQAQVTGSLRHPLYAILLAWCLVGLVPTIMADLLGIQQSVVRDPVAGVGSLLGFVLLVYLLYTYQRTLRDLEGHGYSQSDRNSRSSVSSDAPNNMEGGTRGAIELTPGGGPATPVAAHTPREGGRGGASEAGSDTERAESHARSVEQRLRKALIRVLEVYMVVFLCVMAGGVLGGTQSGTTVGGKVLLTLLDLPYALMGAFDAYLVGGMCGRRRSSRKVAVAQVRRRRQRQNGRLPYVEPAPLPQAESHEADDER